MISTKDNLSPRSAPQPGLLGRLLNRVRAWGARSEEPYLLIMAVLVGMAMGVASVLFRGLLIFSHKMLHRQDFTLLGMDNAGWDVARLFVPIVFPALGGAIVGLLIYRLLKLKGGHGVPSVMKAVATGQVNLPPGMAIKSATSPITIASGGSAGPEGPMVEIGAVVGSLIGRFGHMRKEQMGTLVGCGAAAGVAAIFNAPIGGVIFALELIMRDFTVRRFVPVVIAAVVASVTASAMMPNDPAFRHLAEHTLATIVPSGMLIFQFAVLGVLCGGAGALLISVLYIAHDYFSAMQIPLWVKPAVGGLLVGMVGIFAPGVMGEGYEMVNSIILDAGPLTKSSWMLVGGLLILAVLKILATSLTLGSGGTGGSFAPSMVVGALVGASMGLLADWFMPSTAPDYRVFAMVGMAGVVSSALGTPIAAVLLIYEIAGGRYELMLPLMITVAVSSLVTARMKKGSIYTMSLLRDGFDVEADRRRPLDPLKTLPVAKLMTREMVLLRPEDPLPVILDRLEHTDALAFVVADDTGRFAGVISTGDLRAVISLDDLGGGAIIAQDIADPNAPVLLHDAMASEALELFSKGEMEALAVVSDSTDRIVEGLVYRSAVLRAYHQAATAPHSG